MGTTTTKPLGVLVAEDVLERLKANKLFLTRFGYIDRRFDYLRNDFLPRPPATEDAQQCIDQVEHACQVCAIGACMLSFVRLRDKSTVGQLYDETPDEMIDKM